MNDRRFTPSAQNVLLLAQDCASALGHSYVGSEHLLLGLARARDTGAGRALREHGLEAEQLRRDIAGQLGSGLAGSYPLLGLSPRCQHIIRAAATESGRLGCGAVSAEHLLLGLLQEDASCAVQVLCKRGVEPRRLYREVSDALGSSGPSPAHRGRSQGAERAVAGETRLLDQCSRDLTQMAAAGRLDPVVGREEQLARIICILTRRTKNNPALIGEPGVGKTALAEALALAIAAGDVPADLQSKRVCALEIGTLVAGTKYRGEFEDKLRKLLDEVRRAGNVILFIDEMHTIVGAGSAEGAVDAANILKPALGRGELRVVGATTAEEYRRYIEQDSALERRFQPVVIRPPDRDGALAVLRALKPRYERHHGLTITEEALTAAVDLSVRYLPRRHLPDKAIDLMDEAAARARLDRQTLPDDLRLLEQRAGRAAQERLHAIAAQEYERAALLRDAEQDFRRELARRAAKWRQDRPPVEVGAADVRSVLTEWTGVPVTELDRDERERLSALEETLRRRVIGQDAAISAVARAVRRGRLGLSDPDRPVGSFLFLGPSGVGKTELCRALAAALFGSEEALIRFDMSEYREAHTVSRLVGAPPGYVGHGEGGLLTERVRRAPWSVILLDEIEKAHPDVWNLLLQVMDDGSLTDSTGRKTDFRNAVLILTSNLGAGRFRGGALGFAGGDGASARERAVVDDARAAFPTEFFGRLDDAPVFRPLGREELVKIAELMLDRVASRLSARGIALELADGTAETLIDREDGYGARTLRRAVTERLEDPCARMLLDGSLSAGDTLRAEADGGTLRLSVIKPPADR